MNDEGEVVLSVDSALALAYVHSPSYQQQLETLYLSAMDVGTERFRLDTQFFGTNETFYNHSGGLVPRRLYRAAPCFLQTGERTATRCRPPRSSKPAGGSRRLANFSSALPIRLSGNSRPREPTYVIGGQLLVGAAAAAAPGGISRWNS